MRDSFLRRRLWRKLESLPDERLYQVLDYVEFLETRYGEDPSSPDSFQQLAEDIQDRLRARRAAPWAIRGVMGALSVVDRAVGTAAKTARGLADGLSDLTTQQPDSTQPKAAGKDGATDDGPSPRETRITVE